MTTEKPAPEDIRRRIEEQIAFIDETIDHVRHDRLHDITPLDNTVDEICQAIGRLDDDVAVQLEPAMAEMIGRLESLAAELKEFQSRAAQEQN